MKNTDTGRYTCKVSSPSPNPRSPTRPRASTPCAAPPFIGSAPTLRPRTPPAARRPDPNDAQHAAMTLHSTTFCAIHKCSTLHTARTHHARHARSMSTRPSQPTRGARATRAAARASMPRSPRQTRSRSRHRATRSRTKVSRSCGYARRIGTATSYHDIHMHTYTWSVPRATPCHLRDAHRA